MLNIGRVQGQIDWLGLRLSVNNGCELFLLHYPQWFNGSKKTDLYVILFCSWTGRNWSDRYNVEIENTEQK